MNKLKEEEARLSKTAKTVESASKRHPVQTAFWVGLILIPPVAVALAPHLHIEEGGWLSLTRMQLGYALISLELAMVVYAYGVGDWSRFEPPKLRSTGWGSEAKNPPDANPGGTRVIPEAAPPQAGAQQQPGTPQKPQGGQ